MSTTAAQFDSDIRAHRSTQATVTVQKSDGTPLANQPVTVAQTGHTFRFGTTGANAIPLINGEVEGEAREMAERRRDRLLGLCNAVTLPFYWGRFEPTRGQPDTKRIMAAAKFFKDHGCLVKGHPLCWHTVTAPWLMDLSTDEIIKVQLDRIRRDVTAFAGVIDTWDVINEVVIMPIFDKYDNGITRMCRQLGRIGIIRETFAAAREANPKATLLLNDFDMSAAYECLLEGVLEAGIKIDVLGLQSHQHQGWWGLEKTQNVLERFGRYGLPMHFTEVNLVSGKIMPPEIVDLNDHQVKEWPSTPEGEARQAEEAVTFYKSLMAHPLVESITWWDFVDGGWLNAPAGLIRKNGDTKPAYDALHSLVKGEWWTQPTTLKTDAEGRVTFTGFLGDYTVSHGDKTSALRLETKGTTNVAVKL